MMIGPPRLQLCHWTDPILCKLVLWHCISFYRYWCWHALVSGWYWHDGYLTFYSLLFMIIILIWLLLRKYHGGMSWFILRLPCRLDRWYLLLSDKVDTVPCCNQFGWVCILICLLMKLWYPITDFDCSLLHQDMTIDVIDSIQAEHNSLEEIIHNRMLTHQEEMLTLLYKG